jgi:hypothetical protein
VNGETSTKWSTFLSCLSPKIRHFLPPSLIRDARKSALEAAKHFGQTPMTLYPKQSFPEATTNRLQTQRWITAARDRRGGVIEGMRHVRPQGMENMDQKTGPAPK